jgi:hypothetical protein
MADRYSLDDMRRFVSLIWRPGDVFELRGLARVNGQQHVTSGFFDDPKEFMRAALERSGKDAGVYYTINPTNPALLARAAKNKVRRAGAGDTTSDRDVARRRSILIDIDPVRPTGISSTDEEHAAALAMAWQIAADLTEQGWPEPIFADSGNGAHLIYSVDLPVDDGGLVRRVLEQLSKRYSTPALKVDEKVFNPARISKIYGTLTKKGEDTPERPHRLARLLEAPAQLVDVSRDVLEALAPESKPLRELKQKADRYTAERQKFDLDAFLAEHLPDAKERPWAEGRRWILPTCPFNDSHDRGEAYVTELHSGAVAAGCLHESCKWGWRDLRKQFDPEAYAWEERRSNGNGNGERRLTDREPPPEVLYQAADYDEPTRAEYDRIAEQERDEKPARPVPASQPLYRRAPQLVDAILERANDPWIELTPGAGDVFASVRVGATVVVIGGSGSGKSSLTSCMLVEHAKNVGPAIALSIELPADELAARIVGIKCDASWEDALRGRVPRADMERVLDLPRLWVLDRRRATIRNLELAVKDARAEYPGQPILVAIDYTQLLDSKEREARLRVAEAFAQIDDSAREHKFVALALSQMSRASAKVARKGEALGAETADLGAETAAIERFATLTMTIGMAVEREDGSSAVELSIGKARMGKGDRVIPMTYYGRSGLWRVAGDPKTATEVREQRDVEKAQRDQTAVENQIMGALASSKAPMTRNEIAEIVTGRKDAKLKAVASLLARGVIVEVAQRAPRSRSWKIWTPDRAADAGFQLVRDTLFGGAD